MKWYTKYEKYEFSYQKEQVKMDKNKYVGICKVGEKGQIVIPKDARKHYNLKPGDSLMLIGNDHGMAMVKPEIFYELIGQAMEGLKR